MRPSAHLLRTLAAVAPGCRIVDLACGDGRHLVPLAQLGFDVVGVATADPTRAIAALSEVLDDARQRVVADVEAIGDASADWVVLAFDGAPDSERVAQGARVLRPGGWMWLEVEEGHAAALAAVAQRAGLAEAEEPGSDDGRTHAIYRQPSAVR